MILHSRIKIIYIFLKIPILADQQWPESKNFPDNYSTKVVAILEKGTIVYLLNSTFGLLCGSVQYAGSKLEGIFTALQNSAVYAQASLNLNLNKRGSHCQYCSTLWGQMSNLRVFSIVIGGKIVSNNIILQGVFHYYSDKNPRKFASVNCCKTAQKFMLFLHNIIFINLMKNLLGCGNHIF